MGVSLYVTFNKKVKASGDEHPALGNGLGRLDKVLENSGLPTIGQFVSMDPAEWQDMDPDDPQAFGLPALQWFDPEDGLIAVDAAITCLTRKQKSLKWSCAALAELTEVRAVLVAGVKRNAQFRFEIGD